MILDRFKLTDKVAIVSGGGKGIAYAFAEAGADIVTAAPGLLEIMLVHPYSKETAQMFLEDGKRFKLKDNT